MCKEEAVVFENYKEPSMGQCNCFFGLCLGSENVQEYESYEINHDVWTQIREDQCDHSNHLWSSINQWIYYINFISKYTSS